MKKVAMLAFLWQVVVYGQAQGIKVYWSPVDERSIPLSGIREIIPNKYKTFRLVQNALKNELFAAPLDKPVESKTGTPLIIELPMPDGRLQHFQVVESPTMEEGLAVQFPQLKTFNVRGVEDIYASGKLDWTEFGFHGMIRSPEGDVFLDPYCRNNQQDYITYYVKDFEKPEGQRLPEVGVLGKEDTLGPQRKPSALVYCSGAELRTYRLAVACTGEYAVAATGQTSPTKAQTLSKVLTSVNRVNAIYETEVAIRMVLVAKNIEVLFTDATTDPFEGNDDADVLTIESQSVMDTYIGSDNYDIGHTFSTGGGGLAWVGCVCNDAMKARGITGSASPVGDAYDVDFVAHEIGHQFGARHTFNAGTGACGGNRTAETAVEPGSGVTIMAYAGICGATNNLDAHSIAYFHGVSFDQIMTFVHKDPGNSCAVVTASGNTPPVVSEMLKANYTIPVATPFQLTGSATDPEGDALTYSWEEMDAGTSAGDWNSGSKPFFRSYVPTTNPSRLFPGKVDILSGETTSTRGEYLPTTAQNLTFRFTVRDNKMGGGGVCYPTVATTVNIHAAAGPFMVTYPNTDGVHWASGSTQTVSWEVNGTDAAPVNCSHVNILISTDGGNTFTTLLANTPNDGAQTVTVPSLADVKTSCRIRIECTDNIFFDINDRNFTIGTLGLQLGPNPFTGLVKLTANGLFGTGAVDVFVYDLLGRLVMQDVVIGQDAFVKEYDLSGLSSGIYIFRIFNNQHSSIVRLVRQ